jgi:cob(I)alamin adenosyltransferase
MSIYTKTGDKGTTSLFGGKRASKSSTQVEAYGTLDEFSSWLGFVIAKLVDRKDIDLLSSIQNDLHKVMSVLSGNAKLSLGKLTKSTLEHEKYIDSLDKKLPKLTSFVLPQGGETTSRIHIARTVCRRAERKLASLFSENGSGITEKNQLIISRYINRLSDFLFMLARKYSEHEKKVTS